MMPLKAGGKIPLALVRKSLQKRPMSPSKNRKASPVPKLTIEEQRELACRQIALLEKQAKCNADKVVAILSKHSTPSRSERK